MQGSSRSSNSTQPAESSRSRNVSTVATTKRKAVDELTHFLNSTQLPAASQQVEVIEDDSEDETIEELYCTLPTSVVGVRYYEGERTIIITLISDILVKDSSDLGKKWC